MLFDELCPLNSRIMVQTERTNGKSFQIETGSLNEHTISKKELKKQSKSFGNAQKPLRKLGTKTYSRHGDVSAAIDIYNRSLYRNKCNDNLTKA